MKHVRVKRLFLRPTAHLIRDVTPMRAYRLMREEDSLPRVVMTGQTPMNGGVPGMVIPNGAVMVLQIMTDRLVVLKLGPLEVKIRVEATWEEVSRRA